MIGIDAALVSRLIAEQFPDWAGLRLPSAAAYAGQVAKEQAWLPVLAPHLPVVIPEPVAKGAPGSGYPYYWSVYRWLPGEPAISAAIADREGFANQLAGFLNTLHRIDPAGAPPPSDENFHRGGSLKVYDSQAREAIGRLSPDWNAAPLLSIWERGAQTEWTLPPVWVHGDIAPGNLLVDSGRLSAVIDFGQLCAGDPACDFAIAWTYFEKTEMEVLKGALEPDDDAWLRGQCWALWKAALLVSGMGNSNAAEMASASETLRRLLMI